MYVAKTVQSRPRVQAAKQRNQEAGTCCPVMSSRASRKTGPTPDTSLRSRSNNTSAGSPRAPPGTSGGQGSCRLASGGWSCAGGSGGRGGRRGGGGGGGGCGGTDADGVTEMPTHASLMRQLPSKPKPASLSPSCQLPSESVDCPHCFEPPVPRTPPCKWSSIHLESENKEKRKHPTRCTHLRDANNLPFIAFFTLHSMSIKTKKQQR